MKSKKLYRMFKIIHADLHHLNELADTDDLKDEIKNLTQNIEYVAGYIDAVLENIVDPMARPPLTVMGPDKIPKSILNRIKQAFSRQTLDINHD